jgi:2-haloacid dehalogenase
VSTADAPKSSSRYEVVLFDLDNTLSDFTSAQSAALPALLEDHGVACGADYLSTFQQVAAPLWTQLEAGELALDTLNDERFRLLIEHTDLELDPALLASQYLSWLSRCGPVPPNYSTFSTERSRWA